MSHPSKHRPPAGKLRAITKSKQYDVCSLLNDSMLADLLAPFRVPLNATLAGQIRLYTELLLRWNQHVNLTAITDPAEIVARHFGESMFAASAVPITCGALLDVGTGAGFPGLALKLALPELRLFLMEPTLKKSVFLSETVRALELTDVQIVRSRFEDKPPLSCKMDFVTSRALSLNEELLRYADSVLAEAGRLVAWLGESDAQRVKGIAGWTWLDVISIPKSQSRVLLIGNRAK